MSEIQRLTQSGNKWNGCEKVVHLSSVKGNICSMENARNAVKSAGTGQGMQEVQNGICTVDEPLRPKGGNISNGGSSTSCNFCGAKGNKEPQGFQKNPKKAPEWWKERTAKVELSLSSVEVT